MPSLKVVASLGGFLALMVCGTASAKTVLIKGDAQSIGGELEYFEDEIGQFKAGQLFRNAATPQNTSGFKFQPVDREVPNFGFSSSVFWFRLNLVNTTEESNFVLDISYPLLDYVTFYRNHRDGQKIQAVKQSGDQVPFDKRYRSSRTINFSLQLLPGETAEILFKLKTESSAQFPLTIYTEKAFGDHNMRSNLGFGLYYGVLIIMFIFNLLLFVSLREFNHIIYATFLFFYILAQLALNGFAFQYLWPESVYWANASLLGFMCISAGSCVWFTRRFLKTVVEWMPRLNETLHWLRVVLFIAAPFAFIAPYSVMVKFVVVSILLVVICIFISAIEGVRVGYGPANYFLVAWSFFLLGALLFAFKTVGVLPSNIFTDNGMQIGSVILVTLITLALADHFRDIKAEVERSHRETMNLKDRLTSELEAKLQIFSGIAHQLNNPLNYLSLGVERLSEEVSRIRETMEALFGSAPKDQQAQRIQEKLEHSFQRCDDTMRDLKRGTVRASTVVDEMRGMTGVDGRVSQTMPLELVVSEAFERLKDDLGFQEFSSVRLRHEIGSLGSQVVIGNPYLLILAFRNVLENAFIFSRLGTEGTEVLAEVAISQCATDRHGLMEILVKNNGEIIRECDEDEVFRMGFSSIGRRGTGLNVAQSILRNQGGDIELIDKGGDSQMVNFKVSLPIQASSA